MTSYPNGQVPTSVLSKMGNYDPLFGAPPIGAYIQAEAGRQLIALQNAFYAHFHQPLELSELYRDYARQVELRNLWLEGKGNLAAVPGTSIHGWALACDFGSGVASFGTPQKVWMDANAPAFGWRPTGNGFAPQEAWHFDYTGGATLIAPIGIKLVNSTTPTPAPAPPVAVVTEGDNEEMFAVTTISASSGAEKNTLPKGAQFILDTREKTLTRVDSNPTVSAAQLATLKDEYNTYVFIQPTKKAIGWNGNTPWRYVAGGYTRKGW